MRTVLENVYEKHFLGVENPPIGIHYNFTELLYSADDIFDGSENINDILDHLVDKQIIKDYDLSYKEACFIDFPTDFRVMARKYIKELSDDEQDQIDSGSVFVLHLEKNGNLWHSDKKFCYSMEADSNRVQILKYLIENKGYQPPKEMISYIETETTKTLRSEINKIRKSIKDKLGLDGKDIIESKKNSGYRINPKYKILLSKD